ncbi:CU044_5270 family protein [Streptomyces sp. NPDC048825]|uniref:CU044_5270 family protein n=1 Tax=Streptomyces sp. NPDC048825 TaxID=3365592 RepID=UPI003711CE15
MTEIPEKDLPPGRHRVLREHLMREIRETGTAEEKGSSPEEDQDLPVRTFWRRPAFVAPVAAATLTIAIAVGVGVTRDAATDVPRPGSTDSPMPQPTITKDPDPLLERLAVAAGEERPADIRNDQFVYTKREAYHWKMDPDKGVPGGCDGTDEGYEYGERELWESVDGRSGGLSRELQGNGEIIQREIARQLPGKNTANFYRQAEELPTDPEAMRRWLYGLDPGEKPSGSKSADASAFAKAGNLLTTNLLPPKVAAALYRALAEIPGLIAVSDAEDAAGRTGVAVALDVSGAFGTAIRGSQGKARAELIFDEKASAFLGESVVNLEAPTEKCDPLEAGDLVSSTAVLARGVVDMTSRRP